ncbi:hypothetical protein ACFWPQ_29190 [Streptomyces sp. NPDC058464]|uniref:hypothetical protein n=1 Tax=Streptomyces sp. NPDC058464 TaxID=3346511 RepID=UPI00365E2DAB
MSDWASIRQYVDGLPYGTDRSFAVSVLSEVDGVEQWLHPLVAAAPDDVLALTVLGAREVDIGWKIRTTARAKDVSREQFAALHTHLRQAEQLLIRATALDPSYDAAWAERITTPMGLQLGQNEARRRYDRLARHHPHHFSAQGRLLQQLRPKWSGSREAAHDFARECLLPAPEGAMTGGLVAEVHMEHWLALRGPEREQYLRQDHVRAELVEPPSGPPSTRTSTAVMAGSPSWAVSPRSSPSWRTRHGPPPASAHSAASRPATPGAIWAKTPPRPTHATGTPPSPEDDHRSLVR